MREVIGCRGALPVRDPRADSRCRLAAGSASFPGLAVCLTLATALDSEIAGRSLLPVMMGDEVEHRVAMEGENRRGAKRIALRDGRYEYIAAIEQGPRASKISGPPVPRVQLYDLKADLGEMTNLARQRPELARQLARQLANWTDGLGDSRSVEVKTGEFDDELREQLKALGYAD